MIRKLLAAYAMTLTVLIAAAPGHKFFQNKDLSSNFPLPPAGTPETLQGIFWMDQGGVVGHSDIPSFITAPDLALSFGGDTAFHTLDKKARVLKVDVTGPGWQWFNSPLGYIFSWGLHKIGYYYDFQFNEDYTFAQIFITVVLPVIGKLQLPKFLVSFTMVWQKPPTDGVCPPKSGASKVDVAKCATWDRVTSGLLSPLLGSFGTLHYYVYRILDKDGRPVQPYYDAFIDYADKNANPSPTIANILGIDLGVVGTGAGTSFVHVRDASFEGAKPRAGEL